MAAPLPPSGVNLYATPPGTQGLCAHYDDHSVFVPHWGKVNTRGGGGRLRAETHTAWTDFSMSVFEYEKTKRIRIFVYVFPRACYYLK